MKITCSVCHTTKTIKDEKLLPYKGKTISIKCPNKSCTNKIKLVVPMDIGEIEEKKIIKKTIIKNAKEENTISCPQCAGVVPENTRFCTHCGFDMNPPKKEKIAKKIVQYYCEKCGNRIDADEKFCSKCGTPVSKDSENKDINKSSEKSLDKNSEKDVQKNNEKLPNEKVEISKEKPEKHIKKPVAQPTMPVQTKPKKKSSFLKTLLKIVLGLVLLAIIGFVVLIVLEFNKDQSLQDGPWQINSYRSEILFSGSKKRNQSKWNKAVRQANLLYKSYLDSTVISAPKSVNYTLGGENFLVNQYHPVNKGNLYYFTIKEPNGRGKVNMVLDLKSNTYFEAKSFFISDNEVSIGFIKGTLKKNNQKIAKKSLSNLDNRLLGSWVLIDKTSGRKDIESGWTFLQDGTCYQGTTKSDSRLRTWKTKDNKYLSITFPEQTVTYNYVFEGKKLFFERYRSYYYYIKK